MQNVRNWSASPGNELICSKHAGTDPQDVACVLAELELGGSPAPQWRMELRLFPGGHIVAVATAPPAEMQDEVRCAPVPMNVRAQWRG
jgi:hypothetical protein